ncbi:hypothetical protein K470DRAFT_254010 [Piedraia hortae CBS 480.64]|uniref:Uncharacterized protein n=1 Tax=Piedraia hortae CBS 480.64 TaxID=1314780 RepID=A0A6A7CBB9_9PEZI|nr:hypothetical protein K470DRAFT_254010 [Piedraia hortae CBS 480.64]
MFRRTRHRALDGRVARTWLAQGSALSILDNPWSTSSGSAHVGFSTPTANPLACYHHVCADCFAQIARATVGHTTIRPGWLAKSKNRDFRNPRQPTARTGSPPCLPALAAGTMRLTQ